MTTLQPTLLNSCARAATADELRYRIDGPEPQPRSARIIALDRAAREIVGDLRSQTWQEAHLLAYQPGAPITTANGGHPDVTLESLGEGRSLTMSEELDDADLVVMIATASDGAKAAAVIGEMCYRRGIMTGGVVVGDGRERDVGAAVMALRPHAQVLLVTQEQDELSDVLTALRVA